MAFTGPTDVSLEVSLNDRDFIALTPSTALTYTYYVQPEHITAIAPTFIVTSTMAVVQACI